MSLYGIETEGELISGCFLKFHSHIGREKFEIAQITSRFLKNMRENFREKFFKEFDGMVDDDDGITLEMQRKKGFGVVLRCMWFQKCQQCGRK